MNILGVRYDNVTLTEALEKALSLLNKENNLRRANVFFLNIDCLYKSQGDEEYRQILNSASLVLPDGIGLRLITKLLGGGMKANCNGTDFSPLFMRKASEKEYKIFFLGGKEGVAEKAAQNMCRQPPQIKIVGTHSGYFSDDGYVIEKINRSRADILFVAMGVPLQEKWIAKHREELSPRVCLGVGALFDFLSGHIKRAPVWMQKASLEWLWRLMMEPKRLWKRYLVDDLKFFWLVLRQRLEYH